jgi:thiol-disulfide isomerase/thioredoxin/outer membrane protein assembly factor BamD (BamD/ComL family)
VLIRRMFSLFLLAAMCRTSAFAQYEGDAVARALFEQGEKALRSDNYADAIADYKKAITLDPNFIEAHQQYISTRQREPYLLPRAHTEKATSEQEKAAAAAAEKQTQALAGEYEALAMEHPNSAVYPWALGKLYESSNVSRQEEYCRQALKIDSRFPPGYVCLATIAFNRGDLKHAVEYQARVTELEPDDPDELFTYSFYLEGDPAAYKAATDEMIKRFPYSPRSAQALYWYAVHQTTDAAQVEAFERLRKQYPPAKFEQSADGVTELFHIYDRTDPLKAQSVAHEMLALFPKDADWNAYAAYSDTMAKASQWIEDKPAAAVSILEPMKAPGYLMDMRRKDLLQARALDLSGKAAEAYSYVLGCYAKHPTDEVRAAIGEYGKKLGKTSQGRDAATWSAIADNSTPAIPFSLPDFTDGKLVSLARYRGHVVFVDFWYPNCGPCRESFPFLQQVAVKYKKQGVVVLAINVQEGQEDDVVPLFKSMGYNFIPLKGTQDWVDREYHLQAFPTTFLVGADGRVYFRPHIYDRLEERTAELEVEELLAHGG